MLVYEITRQKPAEEALAIAGIVPVPDGYLLIFSSGKGWLWNFNKAEVGTDGSCAIKVMHISRNFDQLPVFDWWKNVRHAQGNFPLRSIADPQPGQSFIRPIVQQLPDGRSLVVYEQWNNPGDGFNPASAAGVRAPLIDAAGNAQAHSQLFPGLRIQKSTRAFLSPNLGRVAWVNGDGQRNQLVMHTIDANLQRSSFDLGRGAQTLGQTPGQTPPLTPQAIDVDGQWDLATGNFPFTLQRTQQGLRMTQNGTNFDWPSVAGRANFYEFPGANNTNLSFSSRTEGVWTFNGQPFPIRRQN